MIAINKIWGQTNLLERQAWHRITCQNSRTPQDLRVVQPMIEKMQAALAVLAIK
jgi:hypothetical protein